MRKHFYLDPNNEGGTGSTGETQQTQTTQTTETPSYVGKGDFDSFRTENESFRNEVSPRLQKIDEFLSRFQNDNRNQNAAPSEPKLGSQEYPNTPVGIQKWIKASAKFEADRLYEERSNKDRTSKSEQETQAKYATVVQDHVKRIGEASSRYKDWDAVVKNIDLPGNLAAQIMDSDHSADIQYLINRDKGEYFKLLNAQREGKADRVIGRLEQRFESESAARKQADKQTRHQTTIDDGMEAGGNVSREQEFEDMARKHYGLK